jgi:hypothetical protein
MKPDPELVRRRAVQAILIITVLALLSYTAEFLSSSIARFIPPFVLSLIVLLSVVNALLVWRTQWLISKLFSIEEIPVQLVLPGQGRRNAEISAYVGLVFSVVMLILWFRSLL